MDVNRLKYFATVAQTGSIRAAAELLHLSPAALSKAIKLLEQEVGVDLLTASGRGIVLTDRGRELAVKANPLLDGLEQLAQEVRQERDLEPPVRVGSFEVFTTYFMGTLTREHLGDVPLVVHELVPGEMERALEKHEIDLGITYIPIPSSGLDYLKVTELEMGIYGRSKALRHLSFSELPFVIPVHPIQGSPNKVKGLDGWPEDKVDRYVRFRVAMMETALELCRQGVAVAYLPAFVVRLHNATVKPEFALKEFSPPPGIGNRKHAVYLVKRKSDKETKTTRKIAKGLRLALQPH